MHIHPIEIPSVNDVSELTQEQIAFLKLYAAALQDGVDDGLPSLEDADLLEVADGVSSQSNLVGLNPEGSIVAAASYDLERPSGPFFEGIAVRPSERGKGRASQLTRHVLKLAAAWGATTMELRSQPTSVVANEQLLRKLGYHPETTHVGNYPKTVIELPHPDIT